MFVVALARHFADMIAFTNSLTIWNFFCYKTFELKQFAKKIQPELFISKSVPYGSHCSDQIKCLYCCREQYEHYYKLGKWC